MARTANEVLGSRDLGLRRTELSLPQGTLLTAVGELVAEVEHPSAFQVRRRPAAARCAGSFLVKLGGVSAEAWLDGEVACAQPCAIPSLTPATCINRGRRSRAARCWCCASRPAAGPSCSHASRCPR